MGGLRRPFVPVADDDAAALATHAPGLDVAELARRRPEPLASPSRVIFHDGAPAEPLPDDVQHPDVVARHYRGEVTVMNGAYLLAGDAVLPESFRWFRRDPLRSEALLTLADGRLQPRAHHAHEAARAPHLEGDYYYLDYRSTGHYGHFLTEAVARLWAWDDARRVLPGLKLLVRRHDVRRQPLVNRPEHHLLPAFGIDRDDVVWLDGPARVTSLVGCTPQWHNAAPFSADPRLREVWARMAGGMVRAESGPRRIFVTRRGGARECRNTTEVERLFGDAGFVVVDPGALSKHAQADVFAHARVVAGFGGTGMFNLVHAGALERIVVLNHDAYDARNEELFARVLDVEAHFFFSSADVAQNAERDLHEATRSTWAFDLARHMAPLRALLAGC